MDMILTGRAVDATEALAIGLANRVVPKGHARAAAEQLAARAGRAAAAVSCDRTGSRPCISGGYPEAEALDYEFASISRVAAEATEGAGRFAAGAGRHGATRSVIRQRERPRHRERLAGDQPADQRDAQHPERDDCAAWPASPTSSDRSSVRAMASFWHRAT